VPEKSPSEVHGEKTDGEGGARVTGHLEVPCFELPKNVDRNEFFRQLKEQEATINSMTADDMGYAQTVIDQARKEWGNKKGSFTNLLRDSKAQQEARTEYEAALEEAEYSPRGN
jgi:hypothetical protein